MPELRKEDAKKAEELIARGVQAYVEKALPNVKINSSRFALFHGATHYRVRRNGVGFDIECNIGPNHLQWTRTLGEIVRSIEEMLYCDFLEAMHDSKLSIEAMELVNDLLYGNVPAFKVRERMHVLLQVAEKRVIQANAIPMPQAPVPQEKPAKPVENLPIPEQKKLRVTRSHIMQHTDNVYPVASFSEGRRLIDSLGGGQLQRGNDKEGWENV